MNLWKNVALVSVAALFLSITSHVASAAGACKDQPNMAAALESLRSARASLEKAEHNKGGWRVAALEATKKAISETERGCAFDDKK